MYETFKTNVLDVWIAGGTLMIGLAVLGILIYGSIMQALLYLRQLKELSADEDEWGHWIERPNEGKGLIGQMIAFSQDNVVGKQDLLQRFEIIKQKLLSKLDRQIKFSSTVVTAAPLLGLLGTVGGMLKTFSGLATSQGNSLDLVAGGISEALITTQAGLVLALPGMFLIALTRSKRRGLAHFITKLEARTLTYYEENGIFKKSA